MKQIIYCNYYIPSTIRSQINNSYVIDVINETNRSRFCNKKVKWIDPKSISGYYFRSKLSKIKIQFFVYVEFTVA